MTGSKILITMDELLKRAPNTRGPASRSRPKPRNDHESESINPPFVLDDLPEAPYCNEVRAALEDLGQVRRFPFIRRIADSLYVVGSGTFPVDGGTNSIGWRLLPYPKMRDIPADILLDRASLNNEFGTVVVHLLRASPGSTIAMWVHRVEGDVSRDVPGQRWRLTLNDTTRGWDPDRLLFENEPASKARSVPSAHR